ncbi:MAG TPA: metal-sulfur cluster assembly factor [Candidatus Acidoferrales bacterium]|jgi:metal-sulfur cluster biosynthetic enzyme|nr:metal-sulfur cluster assembly factor [Candidatus Acidoferrales bacterium]
MTDTTDITDATESAVEGSKSSTHKGEARASDELVRAALSEVYDPEIGIDIVSLGLIYGTHLDDNGMLTIDMTLTTPYCPLGPVIQTQAHAVCSPLPGVEDVHVNLVWSPPWDPRTMASEEARLELGIY